MYDTQVIDGKEVHCNCPAQNDGLDDRAWWGHHYSDCAITLAKESYFQENGTYPQSTY